MILHINDYEIIENRIDFVIEDYINNLPDNSLIYKSSCFNGLLLEIYKQCFKPNLELKIKHNQQTLINYDDPELINNIFIYYYTLCCRFNHTPHVLGFSMMSGIGYQTILDWRDGKLRLNSNKYTYDNIYNNSLNNDNNDNNNINNNNNNIVDGNNIKFIYQQMTQNWFSQCESGILSGAMDGNSIGKIFALKSIYGYQEQTTQTIQIEQKQVINPNELLSGSIDIGIPKEALKRDNFS